MYVKIQSQSFTVTPAMQNWIEHRLARGMSRFDSELQQVDVYLSDLNGPRGGDDIRVVMRASLDGLPPVSVSCEHQDLYTAANRCAKRLRRAVQKVLKRSRRLQPRKVIDLRRRSLELVGP